MLPNGTIHLNGPLLGQADTYAASATDGKKKVTLVITKGDGTAPVSAWKASKLARIASDTTIGLDNGATARAANSRAPTTIPSQTVTDAAGNQTVIPAQVVQPATAVIGNKPR